MEITGNIKLIRDEQVISDKFKKREFVVTTLGEYEQHIAIEFTQDRCGNLNSFKEGQEVCVSINIRGREWINPKDNSVRYFNTLNAWKIELIKSESAVKPSEEAFAAEGDNDGLPF